MNDEPRVSDEPPELPQHRLWQPTTARWFVVIFGAALAYAVVRYHLAGDVPWRHFPLFILNKATSLAAVFFVACSYLIGKIIRWHDHDKALRLVVIKFCGLMGFFLAAVHAVFSLALLSPAYYGKYFLDDGRLNVEGEIAMTVGVLALFFLLAPAVTTLPMMPKAIGSWRWKRNQRAGYIALALVATHLVVLGLRGWLAPQDWQGGIPPVSLVAVVVAMVPLLVKRKLVADKKTRAAAIFLVVATLVPATAHAQLMGHNLTGDYGLRSGSQAPSGRYAATLYGTMFRLQAGSARPGTLSEVRCCRQQRSAA